MLCHICDSPPIGQCQVCWRFYCRDHGEIACITCKADRPDSGTHVSYMTFEPGSDTIGHPSPEEIEEMLAHTARRRILKSVLPVVQTQTVGETQVTLVSLELYDDCFVAHLRIRFLGDEATHPAQAFFPGLPEFEWA